MGIVVRQTVKATIAMAAGAMLGVALMILQTKLMPKQELGFTRLLTNQSVIAALLISIGIPSTVGIYLHRYTQSAKKKAALLFLCTAIPMLLWLLSILVCYVFRFSIANTFNNSDDRVMFVQYFGTFPIYIGAFMLVIIFEQVLLAFHKTAIATVIKEVVFRIINLLLTLAFAFQLISFTTFIWSWSLSVVVLLLAILWANKRAGLLNFSSNISVFSKQEKQELLRFSLFHLPLLFSATLLTYLDTSMIAFLDKGGLKSVAIYSNSVFVVSLMTIAYRPMVFTSYAALNASYQQEDKTEFKAIYHRSSLNIQVVATLMLLLLICNVHNAARLLGNGYEAIVVLALILAIGRFMDMITGLNDSLFSITNNYTYFIYFTIGIIAALLGLYYYSIPRYGMVGAAWSTTIVLCLYNLVKWWILKAKLKVNPFSSRTLMVLLIGIVAFIPAYFFLPTLNHLLLDIFLRSLIAVTIFVVAMLIVKPVPDVTNYAKNVWKQKRLF